MKCYEMLIHCFKVYRTPANDYTPAHTDQEKENRTFMTKTQMKKEEKGTRSKDSNIQVAHLNPEDT